MRLYGGAAGDVFHVHISVWAIFLPTVVYSFPFFLPKSQQSCIFFVFTRNIDDLQLHFTEKILSISVFQCRAWMPPSRSVGGIRTISLARPSIRLCIFVPYHFLCLLF